MFCLQEYQWTTCIECPWGPEKGIGSPVIGITEQVLATVGALGTEPGSSGKAENVHKY